MSDLPTVQEWTELLHAYLAEKLDGDCGRGVEETLAREIAVLVHRRLGGLAGDLPESASTDDKDGARLRFVYGVPAHIGGRVVLEPRPGEEKPATICGFDQVSAYLWVLVDGDTDPVPCHPTWKVTYL